MSVVRALATLVLFMCIGCASRSTGTTPPSSSTPQLEFTEIAKVKVTRTGDIYLNDTLVSLEDLKREFARLREVNGAVWYYRDDPDQEPSTQAAPIVDAVMQAIVEARIPVRLAKEDAE